VTSKEENMNCPNLTLHDRLYCVSKDKWLVPSVHHLAGCCLSQAHTDCSFYKAFLENVELFSYSI